MWLDRPVGRRQRAALLGPGGLCLGRGGPGVNLEGAAVPGAAVGKPRHQVHVLTADAGMKTSRAGEQHRLALSTWSGRRAGPRRREGLVELGAAELCR